jgi:hypothetical protein
LPPESAVCVVDGALLRHARLPVLMPTGVHAVDCVPSSSRPPVPIRPNTCPVSRLY